MYQACNSFARESILNGANLLGLAIAVTGYEVQSLAPVRPKEL